MADQGLNEKMTILISKYLSGNANSEEIQELEAWVMADPENKKQFTTYKKAWMLSGIEHADQGVDVDRLWQKTSGQLFGDNLKVKSNEKPVRRIVWRIAASLALLLAAAFLVYHFTGKDNVMIAETTDSIKTIALSDGSKVTLNQSSSLQFSIDNDHGGRLAILSGDAFFDVRRDEENPFIIRTQGIEIEVLGTSFYVDSRAGQPEIQVIVQSGSVAVRADSVKTVLSADEKAVYQKGTGSLVKQKNEDANYLSLTSNILNFENSQLDAVIFALNRQFNVDISMAIENLNNCKITATFEGKSLEAILFVIEKTLGIEAIREGDKVILTGAECR